MFPFNIVNDFTEGCEQRITVFNLIDQNIKQRGKIIQLLDDTEQRVLWVLYLYELDQIFATFNSTCYVRKLFQNLNKNQPVKLENYLNINFII